MKLRDSKMKMFAGIKNNNSKLKNILKYLKSKAIKNIKKSRPQICMPIFGV